MTRPNTGISWPSLSDKFLEKAREYDKLGKRKVVSKEEHGDGLKQTTISIFDSEASRFAFGEESDVQDFLNERDVYCISNGITAESSTERI